jgi:hypothetical protein
MTNAGRLHIPHIAAFLAGLLPGASTDPGSAKNGDGWQNGSSGRVPVSPDAEDDLPPVAWRPDLKG